MIVVRPLLVTALAASLGMPQPEVVAPPAVFGPQIAALGGTVNAAVDPALDLALDLAAEPAPLAAVAPVAPVAPEVPQQAPAVGATLASADSAETASAEEALQAEMQAVMDEIRAAQEELAAAESAAADAAADADADADKAATAVQPSAPPPPPVVWESRGLFDLVPEGTATAFHKRSDEGSALADHYAAAVARAVCDAEFDEFLFETLEHAGTPPGLVRELRGYRNLASTFAGAVPWDDLLGHEFVWAEADAPAFGGESGMPGMLLAARPGAQRARDVESSLAMVLGALTSASPIHARLDIHELPRDGGPVTTHYALRVPMDEDITVLQLAVRHDTVLVGLGEAYFAEALALLRDEPDTPRLLATHRFQDAVALLPADATATHYVDVRRQVDTVEDVMTLVRDRSFNTGYWQTTLNDALKLYDHVETIATATRCDGTDVTMETVTRFDPEASSHNPVYQSGLARRASPELLDYVPADAVSFSMQGAVDVAPIYRAVVAEMEARYGWAGPVLMGTRVLGAAADFSMERDVLSWVGSEHIAVTMPSRARHAQPTDTETVTLWKLDDPAGMKKCLARLEAVYNELVPPLLGDLQAQLTEAQSPVVPDLSLARSEGMFPSLRTLQLSGLPMPLPALHFGVLGNVFVMAPSQEALESCLAAAAFMEPGLEERPLAAELIGRTDLTGASMEPFGRGTQDMLQGIGMLQAFVLPSLRGATAESEYAWAAGSVEDLLGRITGVLESIDFLGDAVTWSERRAGGLVQYECTRLELAPSELPARGDPIVSR